MRFLPLFLVFLFSAIVPAKAQDKVSVRTSARDNYTRLVFEWPAQTGYSLSKEGGRILVRFARAGNPDLGGVEKGDANIKDVQPLSSKGEPLQMAITIPEGSTFRDLAIQNKVILDVYRSDPQQAAAQSPVQKQDAHPTPAQTPPPPPGGDAAILAGKGAVAAGIASTQEAPASVPVQKTAAAEPTPAVQQERTEAPLSSPQAQPLPGSAAPAQVAVKPADPAPSFDPHFLTFTATSNLGLAAYERNGALYIVTDAPDVEVDPLLSGPQKDRIPPIQKFNIPGGTGYKMDLPRGLRLTSVDGGGLNWKIALSGKLPTVKGVAPQITAGGPGQDGRLTWPMRDMRKILTYTDPVVGDKIVAVTADSADQAAGAARRFVNLDALNSGAGLVFVPKSDNVKADIEAEGVSVAQPGGLILSAPKDTQVEKLREATQDGPPELPDPSALAKQQAPPPEEPQGKTQDGHKDDVKTKEAEPEHASAPAAKDDVPAHEEAAAQDAHAGPGEDVPAHPETGKAALSDVAGAKPAGNNIYNFQKWEGGGLQALESNLHLMMVNAAAQKPENRVQDFLTMAKLNLANGRGAEAIGLLRMTLIQVPDLASNPEFQALRSAAFALSGKYDEAIDGYNNDKLQKYDDVKLWRAYTLAGLEDWKQAIATMPSDLSPIGAYPSVIRIPMALSFAEIELRAGKVNDAKGILESLEPFAETMALPYKSAMTYLEGEAARQSHNPEQAIKLWTPLVKDGKDDLYRAKAGLSLTKLQIEMKALKPEEAIDRLEGLRYAWRGDELEALVNYRLAQMYIDNKDYLKGLTVLRSASNLSPGTEINKSAREYMIRTYRDIFTKGYLDNLSPLEAISVYQEFKTLNPPGDEGNAYLEKLAERMVNAELLGRAAALLDELKNRLQGDKKAAVAIRLAAIQLLDGNPAGALRSLDVAQASLGKASGATADVQKGKDDQKKEQAGADGNGGEDTAETAGEAIKSAVGSDAEKQRQILLLKARALSMMKKPDNAMAILDKMRLDADVNKLRTDIAWGAGKWEDAADALNDLLMEENIDFRGELTPYQRDVLLNEAIALNLSGNRVGLANLRNRYADLMNKTAKGKLFDVVTRPRRPDMIGSREAIQSMISEIDLFKGFLDSYSKMGSDEKGASAPVPPAAGNAPAPQSASSAATPADAAR